MSRTSAINTGIFAPVFLALALSLAGLGEGNVLRTILILTPFVAFIVWLVLRKRRRDD